MLGHTSTPTNLFACSVARMPTDWLRGDGAAESASMAAGGRVAGSTPLPAPPFGDRIAPPTGDCGSGHLHRTTDGRTAVQRALGITRTKGDAHTHSNRRTHTQEGERGASHAAEEQGGGTADAYDVLKLDLDAWPGCWKEYVCAKRKRRKGTVGSASDSDAVRDTAAAATLWFETDTLSRMHKQPDTGTEGRVREREWERGDTQGRRGRHECVCSKGSGRPLTLTTESKK